MFATSWPTTHSSHLLLLFSLLLLIHQVLKPGFHIMCLPSLVNSCISTASARCISGVCRKRRWCSAVSVHFSATALPWRINLCCSDHNTLETRTQHMHFKIQSRLWPANAWKLASKERWTPHILSTKIQTKKRRRILKCSIGWEY